MSDNDYDDRNQNDDGQDNESSGGRRGRSRRDNDSGGDDRRSSGGRRRSGGGRRRRKEDYFFANKTIPNYKDVEALKRFMTERAKIRPRRQTGLTSRNQRKLAREIKRARHLALLPFTDEQTRD